MLSTVKRSPRVMPQDASDLGANKRRSASKTRGKPSSLIKSISKHDIVVFQIHYKGDQKEHLDPAFIEFDNKKGEAETHEFAVFEQLQKSKQTQAATYWGAVSWRFGEKTGLTGEQLISVVRSNPRADVFYMNPFPYNEALFQSGWMQGETVHPDFLTLSEKVLTAGGYDRDEVHRVSSSHSFSSANYFVGNQKFWSTYIPFVQKLLSDTEKNLPESVLRVLHSSKADARNLHNQSTYVPFIVERLFPLFMQTAGKGLATAKVTLPEQEKKLNDHLRKLREMKDAAVKGKSEWLIRAWMNYRNLYLQSAAPKDWCKKYLPVLNPKTIVW